MNKTCIFGAFLLLLLLFPTQQTILSYIVQQDVDQADTIVQLKAKIQVDGKSLNQSIAIAQKLINNLEEIVIDDCQRHTKKKSEAKKCKENIEASKFEVEAKYHLVRKIKTFTRTTFFMQSLSSLMRSLSRWRIQKNWENLSIRLLKKEATLSLLRNSPGRHQMFLCINIVN